MSQQQGLILVVSDDKPPAFATVLGEAMFPVIETSWTEASGAVGLEWQAASAKGRAAKSRMARKSEVLIRRAA